MFQHEHNNTYCTLSLLWSGLLQQELPSLSIDALHSSQHIQPTVQEIELVVINRICTHTLGTLFFHMHAAIISAVPLPALLQGCTEPC